jgi:hypothetical protein
MPTRYFMTKAVNFNLAQLFGAWRPSLA